ncbi:hypothetical protein JVX91_17080 [Pseudomonas sp. PDNC002]|uniref:hypothetical protein n=1 Tax=Pseudomonas sp. PDNC002 TaxID=2811422 RepID=UPI001962B264|nr:hypothetical protein [Pseudomonas sp. PDNC002]QRY77323.1 hypothetical protein JVX91_17080 [Pseudomonas sp. PDNC002]
MDFIEGVVINYLAHRIGVRLLSFLSGGRFKGESGFAWGWAVVVGGLILFSPFVAFIAWLIHRSAG